MLVAKGFGLQRDLTSGSAAWVPAQGRDDESLYLQIQFSPLSSSGLTGRSSTPRPIDSSSGVSGILDRPPEPVIGAARCADPMAGDDVGVWRALSAVIASEAKQSMQQQERMDCFVARAPRNDGETHIRILAARGARRANQMRNHGGQIASGNTPSHPA
jgi:hypothetical protein